MTFWEFFERNPFLTFYFFTFLWLAIVFAHYVMTFTKLSLTRTALAEEKKP